MRAWMMSFGLNSPPANSPNWLTMYVNSSPLSSIATDAAGTNRNLWLTRSIIRKTFPLNSKLSTAVCQNVTRLTRSLGLFNISVKELSPMNFAPAISELIRLATEYKSLFFSASSALTNSFGVNVPPDMMNGAVLPTIAIADRRSKGLVKLIGHHPLEWPCRPARPITIQLR